MVRYKKQWAALLAGVGGSQSVVLFAISMFNIGNAYRRGRLSTIDLLIKMACLVKKKEFFIKSSRYELFNTRRSTVLILPIQLVFPGLLCSTFPSRQGSQLVQGIRTKGKAKHTYPLLYLDGLALN